MEEAKKTRKPKMSFLRCMNAKQLDAAQKACAQVCDILGITLLLQIKIVHAHVGPSTVERAFTETSRTPLFWSVIVTLNWKDLDNWTDNRFRDFLRDGFVDMALSYMSDHYREDGLPEELDGFRYWVVQVLRGLVHTRQTRHKLRELQAMCEFENQYGKLSADRLSEFVNLNGLGSKNDICPAAANLARMLVSAAKLEHLYDTLVEAVI